MKKKIHEIARFSLSGGIAQIVYYGLLYLLVEFYQMHYTSSAIFSSLFSFVISFVLQKWWTFKNHENLRTKRQMFLYLLMSVVLTFANSILLMFLYEYQKFGLFVAQGYTSILLSVISYLVTRKIFK